MKPRYLIVTTTVLLVLLPAVTLLPQEECDEMRNADWLVFRVFEGEQGEDLNGDGDSEDHVWHVRHVETGETTNLVLASESAGGCPCVLFEEESFVFQVSESEQGVDLNGDGDAADVVCHWHGLDAGTVNLGFDSESCSCGPEFLRGDCNDDGEVDISDAISTLGALFLGDGDPTCDDACDSNDDGAVDISAAINTLTVIFLGEGTIPLSGRTECGVDPTDDEVGCDTFERCP